MDLALTPFSYYNSPVNKSCLSHLPPFRHEQCHLDMCSSPRESGLADCQSFSFSNFDQMYRCIQVVEPSKRPDTADSRIGRSQNHCRISRKTTNNHERRPQTNELYAQTGYLFAATVDHNCHGCRYVVRPVFGRNGIRRGGKELLWQNSQ